MKILISIVFVLITLIGSYSQEKKLRKDERKEKQQIERELSPENWNPIRDASGISEIETSGIEIIGNRIVDDQVEEKLELMLSKPPTLHAGYYFFGERQREAQMRFLENLNRTVYPKDDNSFKRTAKEFQTDNGLTQESAVVTRADEPIYINSTSGADLHDRYQFFTNEVYHGDINNIPNESFDRPIVTFDRNETIFPPEEPYIIRTSAPNEYQNNFSGSDFRTPTKPLSSYSIQKTHRRSQD